MVPGRRGALRSPLSAVRGDRASASSRRSSRSARRGELHPAVVLEHRLRLDGEGDVVGEGRCRRLGRRRAARDRAKRVAQPRVGRQLAAREPALDRGVVDHEAVVEGLVALGVHRPHGRLGVLRDRRAGAREAGVACDAELAARLLRRADREVEHLEGQPLADQGQRRSERVVVPLRHDDVRVRAMDDLHLGVERVGEVGGRPAPDRHPLVEGTPVVRPGNEVPPEAAERPEPRRHGGEDVAERAVARPPELVRVAVDHPVRAVLGCRQARHAGHPVRLPELLGLLADQGQPAVAREPLEDLGRPVARAVVGDDDVVDAEREVVREVRLDDVRLVADEEREDDPHRPRRSRRRSARSAR